MVLVPVPLPQEALEDLVVVEVATVPAVQEIPPQHHQHKEQMVELVYQQFQVILVEAAAVPVEIRKLTELQLEQVMVVQEQSLRFLEHQLLMVVVEVVVCIFLAELLVLPDLVVVALVRQETLPMQLGILLEMDL